MRSAGEDLDTHAVEHDCNCYYASQFEVNGCVFTVERWLIVYTECISHLQCMRPEYVFLTSAVASLFTIYLDAELFVH